jgi:ankyrin repeat protein
MLSDGVTPDRATLDFLQAASEGDLVALKTLIDRGVDINATRDWRYADKIWCGAPALVLANTHNHLQAVKLLLEHRADIDGRNDDSALYCVCGLGF